MANVNLRTTRWALIACAVLLSLVVTAPPAPAQIPVGYYDTVDTTSAAGMRPTLHDVIDDHTRFPYTAATTDTWDILNMAQEDPANPGRIIDIYRNASYAKISGGIGAYNREHVWPKSYGFPNNDGLIMPYTDCHHLFLSDSGYNSARSNKPFRNCNAGCTEETTMFNDGRGGGSGVFPGNSNWTTGSFTAGTWETWAGRKGDVARAILYMDIRYEGGTHGITGTPEPDLIVTDNEALIDSFNTGSNEATAYMGMRSVLLQWHLDDPVDDRERFHNEVVFSFQGNRNPFIDHPEWVDCLYNNVCNGVPDTTPPAAPMGLIANAGAGSVDLDWLANSEPDLAGYNIYRATATTGPFVRINGPLVAATVVTDTAVVPGTLYFYVVRAVDNAGNESTDSNQAAATPTGGGAGGGSVILSEVVYDVSGADSGFEWVELFNAGTSPVDLSSFSLGNGGTTYTTSTVQLSGIVAPGATFVVGGPTANAGNGNPIFDLAVDFAPDFQNSGTAADGVALFDIPALQVTAATVPIDAVIYGPVNSNGLIDETGTVPPSDVGDAGAGSSIERVNLAGTWQIQPAPTPNASPLGGAPPPGNNPPSVTITGPANGASFPSGSTVTFTATASDVEDGALSASVVWSSNLDGALGAGASVGAALSSGSHTITASVTDSAGASTSSTITVTVQAPPASDSVSITKAEWDGGKSQLKLEGTVSSGSATLTVTFGARVETITTTTGRFKRSFNGVTSNPGTVTVTSSGGGSATATVTQ